MHGREVLSGTAGPWWLSEPCPSWCGLVTDHKATDHPDDRRHFSDDEPGAARILLTLVAPDPGGAVDDDPPCLDAYLSQHWREVEPRMVVSVSEGAGLELTLSEADRLQERLNELLKLASRG